LDLGKRPQSVSSPLLQSGVAVEKLDLSKLLEKTLRWEALQTTFLVFLDIFYLPNCRCFEKNGVFQHPQVITLIETSTRKDEADSGQQAAFSSKVDTPRTGRPWQIRKSTRHHRIFGL
jgi:hypothetical protein